MPNNGRRSEDQSANSSVDVPQTVLVGAYAKYGNEESTLASGGQRDDPVTILLEGKFRTKCHMSVSHPCPDWYILMLLPSTDSGIEECNLVNAFFRL